MLSVSLIQFLHARISMVSFCLPVQLLCAGNDLYRLSVCVCVCVCLRYPSVQEAFPALMLV